MRVSHLLLNGYLLLNTRSVNSINLATNRPPSIVPSGRPSPVLVTAAAVVVVPLLARPTGVLPDFPVLVRLLLNLLLVLSLHVPVEVLQVGVVQELVLVQDAARVVLINRRSGVILERFHCTNHPSNGALLIVVLF